MHEILNNNLFFVKEHTGTFKAANSYDILNPETQELWMTCREENMGCFAKAFRFTDYKTMTPFHIDIKAADGTQILSVKRGTTFWASKVEVFDGNDQKIGMFKQQMFSFGGKFNVMDASENVICQLKGTWSNWDFTFSKDGVEFANVSKKYDGLMKEIFTTADNYLLTINEVVPKDNPMRMLILAAVICIDMVLKE